MILLGFGLTSRAQCLEWVSRPNAYSNIQNIGKDLFKVTDSAGRIGVMRGDGEVAVEVKYGDLTPYAEGRALLLGFDRRRILGLLDEKGNMVRDFSNVEYYVGRYPYFKEGRLPFSDAEGFMGYLNERGEAVVSPSYFFCAPFQDGVAAVQYSSGEYGLIGKGGKSAIVSNYKYPFISNPVNGQVLAITGTRKGADALHIYDIDGAQLKKVITLEEGENISLSDDFTAVECQKGNKYYIDDQWRISGTNSGKAIPAIPEEESEFLGESSSLLAKINAQEGGDNGVKIVYDGYLTANNMFRYASLAGEHAVVGTREGGVGLLRLNRAADMEVLPLDSVVNFHHYGRKDLMFEVDLNSVDPDRLVVLRNDGLNLVTSRLESKGGKHFLRIPYYAPHADIDDVSDEEMDLTFIYDGLDWRHETVNVRSCHKPGYEVSISGDPKVNASGRATLNIGVRSLNGPANASVSISGVGTRTLDGESLTVPVTVTVADNATRKFEYDIMINEDKCPIFKGTVSKSVQGNRRTAAGK